jgi:hypothetical protein
MTIRTLLAGIACALLFGCGGEVSIGYRSGGSSADFDSDLQLTVRVDEGQPDGFTTRIGPEGATISLNSGQRLRITADEPAVLTLDANGANVDLVSSSSTVWEGVISSPVNTSLTFRFSSIYYSDDAVLLRVDIRP